MYETDERNALLHLTISELLAKGKELDALSIAKKAIAAAEGDWGSGPFIHAEACQEAWFQLALLQSILGNKDEAAAAAKKSFEYDRYFFDRHLLLVEMMLEVEEEEYDKVVADLAWWFNATLNQYHGRAADDEKIWSLVERHTERSKVLFWAAEDRRYFSILAETDNDPSLYETLHQLIEEFRENGRPDNECDALKCNILYFEDRESEILEVWGDRPISDIPFLAAFERICRRIIEEGGELPSPLPFPDVTDTYQWLNAARDSYLSISELVNEDGLTPEIIDSFSDEERLRFVRMVSLVREISSKGMALYEAFINGEMNGSATTVANYVSFLNHHATVLGKTGDRRAGIELLESGLERCPFKETAQLLVSLALDMHDGQKALDAMKFLEEHYSEGIGYEERHRRERLKLWSIGLLGDMEAYFKAESEYFEAYKGMYRYFRGFHYELFRWVPQQFKMELDEYIFASNNRHEILKFYWEKYPDHPELISRLLFNRAINPSRETSDWAVDFIKKIDILRQDKDSEEGKRRLCWALVGASYLMKDRAEPNAEEEDSVLDTELMDKALALIDEGEQYAVEHDQRVHLLLNRIICYEELDDLAKVKELCEQMFELLKDETPLEVPEDIRESPFSVINYPIDDSPSLVLGATVARYAFILAKEEAPEEEQLNAFRRWYRLHPTNIASFFKIACLTFKDALSDPNSEAYKECTHFASRYITFMADYREDEERSELLAIMLRLALKQKKIYLARVLFSVLEEDYPELTELESLKNELSEVEEETLKGEYLQEVTERRRRSIETLQAHGLSTEAVESIPYVDGIAVAKQRSAEEIARVAIGTTLIVGLVYSVLTDDFDEETFTALQEDIERFGVRNAFSKMEEFILSRFANEPDLVKMFARKEKAAVLFWALGAFEELEFPIKECTMERFIELIASFDNFEEFMDEVKLRDISEILDRLDLIYCYNHCLLSSDQEDHASEEDEGEEDVDLDGLRGIAELRLAALDWLVDADGVNDWFSDLITVIDIQKDEGATPYYLV